MTGRDVAEFRKRYRFTRSDVDRHGNRRWYVLHPVTGRKIRLKAEPGSDAFEAQYNAVRAARDRSRAIEGSLEWMIQQFLASPEFLTDLKPSTQAVRRRILAKVITDGGDLMAREVTSADIRAGRNARRDTPAAANNRMKAISAVYEWGKEEGLVDHNPVRGVKRLKETGPGHHTWTVEECLQYEERHAVGTMARLVYALALYTASRVSDVHRLGPQHVSLKTFTEPDTGAQYQVRGIHIVQEKTNARVWLPVVPPLAVAIDNTPPAALAFALTAHGKPFSVKGLSNKMRQWCDEAGLPGCSMHGLRKATATRLAAYGMSTREIAAVTGHKTLSEVQHYTEEVDQALLALGAMRKTFGGN
ncbi:site-specific integrase [Hyphomonas sp. UBA4494]|jgi:integrase|uniref:site-specific integrase n=1 Tax=Hyphomonas sp. UBA4494 TaxID=1946631 RepID=UPI0025BFE4D8|nr:tyrosine-type recombinase/integrase [Hyphomonas sp. UBA4494]